MQDNHTKTLEKSKMHLVKIKQNIFTKADFASEDMKQRRFLGCS